MNMKAAIFDMDGTLVDSLMIWDVIWSTFGKTYLNDLKFKPSVEDDKKVRTLPLKDAMYLIHDHYHLGKSGDEVLKLANRILFDFYATDVQLKPGVAEFLEYCYHHNVKMCMASATAPELLDVALKHCDIEKYFSKIFSCGTLGKGKESPDVFLLANEFLGEKMEDTWVFEDSLTAIETVTKIGMKTVGIFDRFNYGQERIEAIATTYIAEGETLLKLIES
jgi:HAD superfamily hydrolase (TIGR01509 family)